MAEEKFQYTLELSTRAIGDGAKRTADDMERLNRAVTASQDKAKVSEFGYYDLDAQMRRTTRTTETFTSGVTKMKGPVRDNSQVLLLFSQGFEDASYGIRGVLNNIPGLIIALGGTAGLAGGISIAAVAFSQLLPLLTSTEEKSSDVADRIKDIASNMGEAEVDRFDAVGESIQFAAERTAALKQEWDATSEAEQQFSTAALSNAEKLAAAQTIIAQALGLQVDRFKELDAIAAAQAAKRELEASQAIAAEEKKLKDARDAVKVSAAAASNAELKLANARAGLVARQGQLELLRQQRDELEKTAALRATFADAVSGTAAFPGQNNVPAALAAQKQLDNPAFQSELAGTQERVNRLEELVRSLANEGTGDVAKAETALLAAQTRAADVQRAVEINVARIEETLAVDTTLARTQDIVKQGETLATELQTTFGAVQTQNERGIAAKDSILAAAADGKITAEEARQVAVDTRTLIGLLQAGMATTNGNISELINLQKANEQVGRYHSGEIQSLWGSIRSLQAVKR